ncbi:hypothetical protein niasHT_037407 [Heterodera trifolii]|uniref:Uncharacterized protein n=1 Tax=Heterodera trifolii TaxID=157864 RepID=A0ABD2J298_9BILA
MIIFVVCPEVGAIGNQYQIHPPDKYKIVVAFYVPEHLKKTGPIAAFQTDIEGRVKFSFYWVFNNPFVVQKLKKLTHIRVKVAVYVYGGEENEVRLLHPYKMFKYNEANERKLVRTVDYGEFMQDREHNEYRLHEVFQIVFKELPLVKVDEIDFERDDWKKPNNGEEEEDDDEDDADDEHDDEEEDDEEDE